MKQHNHDSQTSSTKKRSIFFGSTVTGLVNDLDGSDFSIRGISGKLFQGETADTSEQKRKASSTDKDK